MTDERRPEQMTEEEIELERGGPFRGPHGEPVLPRVEPLPSPVVIPPVPGEATQKPRRT